MAMIGMVLQQPHIAAFRNIFKYERISLPPPMKPVKEIAPSIYQVLLPLPFALRIVNCYLIRDTEGWTIIDTGLHIPEGPQTWLQAFNDLNIRPGTLQRIILTHYHPDHYGLSGWLQSWHAEQGYPPPPVFISAIDGEQARIIFQSDGRQVSVLMDFFRRCGMPEDLAQLLTEDIQKLHRLLQPPPDRFHILSPGETLAVGDYRFHIIHTPGHSDGHLVFWDEASRILLCGDHVLQHITPNISQWPTTAANPLGRYIASLKQLESLPVQKALPGHGPIITDWQGRLQELQHHHEERLAHMYDAVQPSASVYDVATQVFDFPSLSYHEMRFAIAETRAHLEHLVHLGELALSENGVWRYEKSSQ